MQTISELNKTWWYRFTKLIVVIVFVLVNVVSVLVIRGEFYSNILSDNGYKPLTEAEYNSLREEGISHSEIMDKEIRKKNEIQKRIFNNVPTEEVILYLIKDLSIIFVVNLLILFLIQKSFYYVYFGTIKPRKV
jgi:hypothetical protein